VYFVPCARARGCVVECASVHSACVHELIKFKNKSAYGRLRSRHSDER
jgi:hypothetical protein